MLAADKGLHALGVQIIHFRQLTADSCRVQRRAASDDAVLRQSGQAPYVVGHDIDRVGYHKENPVEAALHHRAHDALHNLHAGLQHLQAIMRILRHRCRRRDNNDIRIRTVRIISGLYLNVAVHEINGVLHIQCFRICLILVDIDQYDLLAQSLIDNGISRCGSHIADTDDCYLGILKAHPNLLLLCSLLSIPGFPSTIIVFTIGKTMALPRLHHSFLISLSFPS